MSNYQKDEKELEELKTANRKVLKDNYEKYRQEFATFLVKKFACTFEEALTVYPESYSKFYFSIKSEKLKLPLQATLKTFLFTIGKNLFHKRFFNKYHQTFKAESDFEILSEQSFYDEKMEAENRAILVKKLLNEIGEPCKKLLTLFFIKEYASEVVAEILGIEKVATARKRKFDCLKKMRAIAKKKKLLLH